MQLFSHHFPGQSLHCQQKEPAQTLLPEIRISPRDSRGCGALIAPLYRTPDQANDSILMMVWFVCVRGFMIFLSKCLKHPDEEECGRINILTPIPEES